MPWVQDNSNNEILSVCYTWVSHQIKFSTHIHISTVVLHIYNYTYVLCIHTWVYTSIHWQTDRRTCTDTSMYVRIHVHVHTHTHTTHTNTCIHTYIHRDTHRHTHTRKHTLSCDSWILSWWVCPMIMWSGLSCSCTLTMRLISSYEVWGASLVTSLVNRFGILLLLAPCAGIH